eukprot:758123-Hanusia_phi.AAC.2
MSHALAVVIPESQSDRRVFNPVEQLHRGQLASPSLPSSDLRQVLVGLAEQREPVNLSHGVADLDPSHPLRWTVVKNPFDEEIAV